MNYNFSSDIKSIREILDLTQEDLAVQIDVQQKTISKNESEEIEPSEKLLKIFYAYAFSKNIRLNKLKEMIWRDELEENEKLLFHGAKNEITGNIDIYKGREKEMLNTFMEIGILIVGFVLLIKGADFFVDGSSSVAKRLKVPSMIIGLTIVAMGTSLPECAVSVTASLSNNNALAVSNVVGSNLFNLMVVCGVCTLFVPLAVSTDTLKKEFPFSIICAALLLVFGLDSMLGRVDSAIFLVLFAAYLGWMIYSALQARNKALSEDNDEEIKLLPVWQCIVCGAAAIKFGGDFVVEGATAIATMLGLSQNLIGLTIVALGTSLPELVTSIVAARKNEIDMALGNVIGSNIFNILLVLGIAGVISPVAIIAENLIDTFILIAVSTLVWVFAWKKKELVKWQGIVMLAIYAAYLVYICMR